MPSKQRPEPRRGPARYMGPDDATDCIPVLIKDLVVVAWIAGEIGGLEDQHGQLLAHGKRLANVGYCSNSGQNVALPRMFAKCHQRTFILTLLKPVARSPVP